MSALPLLVALGGLYAAGVLRVRRPWPRWRSAAWAAGLVALGAALAGPVDAGADRRLADHMVQHLLLTGPAPLLLAAAAPVRLALAASGPAGRRRVAGVLRSRAGRLAGRPAVALPAAVAVLVGFHLTGLFALALEHPLVHAAEHAALFWTALVAWVVLLGVDPLPHTPGVIGRLAWLTALMTAMAVVGAVLVSADHVLWAPYAAQPNALADQRAGGTVMWLGGVAILVPATLAICGHALWREEQRQRRREAAGARP
jgi:cytochrome c oxidase assembly factor CtaG